MTVTNANENPVITSNGGGANAAISVAENTTAVTTVTSTDVDGGAPSYSISGGADAARFTINAGTGVLTFNLAPDFEAPADAGLNNVYDVTVQVSDGLGGSDTQAISVTVTNANENPVAANDAYAVAEDNVLNVAAAGVLANDTDVDGDALTIVSYTAAANGAVTVNADGSLTYTPNANFAGIDSFTYTGSDGNGGTASATVTITVTPVNDAPVLGTNGGLTLVTGTNATIAAAQLAVTDVDNTAAQITYTLAMAPTNGVLLRNGVALGAGATFTQADIDAGLMTYQNVNPVVADGFSFSVADGAGGTIGATGFAITVQIGNPGGGGPPPVPPGGGGPPPVPPIPPGDGINPVPPGPGSILPPEFEYSNNGFATPPAVAVAANPAAPVATPVATAVAPEIGPSEGAELSDSPALRSSHSLKALWEAVDAMRRQVGEEDAAGRRSYLIAKAAAGGGFLLTAGFVAWILRSGALFASLVSTLPLWKGYDPLPILAYKRRRDEDKEDDTKNRMAAVRDREERAARKLFAPSR